MAFVKIRGEQIVDGVLKNQHIAANAAIHESKLDINWASHASEILTSRKVVDFVQVNGTVIPSGVSEIDLVAAGIFTGSEAHTDSNPLSAEGIIVSGAKNVVILRDVTTGEPLVDENQNEVHGHVIHDGSTFKLQFVTDTAPVDHVGEVPFVFAAETAIDWQYAQRFNLETVNEMFAANEKFVNGAADVTSSLNIQQIAKDLYGVSYTLDRDGNANLSRSLVDEVLVQTRGLTNTAVRANTIIDEVVAARGGFADISARFTDVLQKISDEAGARAQAITDLKTDLASTAAGKGASTIGIEDTAAVFTATTVEGALAELESRVQDVEGGGSATGIEVEAARKSTALTGVEVTHADLDTRLEAGETVIKATKDEVTAARGSEASLDARLDRALNENGTLKNGEKIHTHKKFVYVATGGETAVNLGAGDFFQLGDDTLDVYVNGVLQAEGIHYTEVADVTETTKGKGVNFNPEILVSGDVIILKYIINEAE